MSDSVFLEEVTEWTVETADEEGIWLEHKCGYQIYLTSTSNSIADLIDNIREQGDHNCEVRHRV